MKKYLIFLFLIVISGVLFSEYFWDFETDPWTDGWTSVEKNNSVNWPQRWDWQPYNTHNTRPPDPITMTMWCSSWRAGSGYVLRDTIISPVISDSVNFTKWFKWGIGYRYRSGRDDDTASVLIRTCNAGTWSNWQQLTFYFGSSTSRYDSVDISAIVHTSDSFQVGFSYRGGTASDKDYYVGIDNVNLTIEMTYPGGPSLPPTGPDSILTNNNYTYTSDAVAGTVEYQFDWGDGTSSTWSANTFADKNWTEVGTYFVRSRVRHTFFPDDSISDWSDSLVVKALNFNTVYYWGFEENDGGFPTYYLRDWEWGVPASGPGNARSGAKLWATDLNGNYNQNYSWLRTPEMFLSAADSAMFYFWMWYDSDFNIDGLNLYIGSSDNFSGSFWYGSTNRYYDEIPGSYINPVYTGNFYITWTSNNQDGWTGNGRSWVLYRVNVTEYKDNDSLEILMRLADNSGTAGNLSGFYVDDIRVDTFMRIAGPTTAPSGTDSGYIDSSYMYISEAIGSHEYQFDWGDGTLSGWNVNPNQYHTWSEVGTYYVRSRIRDTSDTTLVSFWSPPLIAKMVKPQTVYYWGFEEDNGGYDNRGSGDWEWGIPQNGPSCARTGEMVWATDLDGIYNTNASWCLSNNINVSYADSAVMYFWMWYESDWNVDGVALMISSDSLSGYPGTWLYDGTYWDTIPANLLNPVYTGTFYFSWRSCTQSGWTGPSTMWTLYSFNITPYSTFEDLNVLWRLADNSGTGGNLSGFYIDDVRVDTSMFPVYGPLLAPTGPSWGFTNISYSFVSDTATSGFGTLEYQFDWGDGSYSSWDTTRTRSYLWTSTNVYYIRTRARVESDTTKIGPWSPAHSIEIGITGYFDPPWTFEPGYQGWTPSTSWHRGAADEHGATWQLEESESWTMWAQSDGLPYVCDTTFSPQVATNIGDKYLIWTGCFRNSTSVVGDTGLILYKYYKDATWTYWEVAHCYTTRTYPNWFYKEIPSIEGADSFQIAVIYIHRDGTSTDRFMGFDNMMLSNRPYITEVGWNFENNTNIDWVHTNNNTWPNGWQRRSSSTVSSLRVPNDGSYSMWIGRLSSHNVPLIDTTFSPATWNPVNVKDLIYGIGFNNQYDSIVIIMSGYDTAWSDYFEINRYERSTTNSFVGYDTVDISAFTNYARVELGFIYYSSINNGAAVIDNIALYTSDALDALVIQPGAENLSVFASAGNYPIEAKVFNAGTSTANFTVKANVLDITTNSLLLDETVEVKDLIYGDSITVGFGNVDLIESHKYIKKIILNYPGDEKPANDTLVSTIICGDPKWVSAANMPVELSGACAWFDEEGLLHVVGDSLHLIYNKTYNAWTYGNPLPYDLISGKCAVSFDEVYIVGEFRNQEDIMIVYNTTNDNYQVVDIPEDIENPSIVCVSGAGDNYIYLIQSEIVERPICYFYDQLSNSFYNTSLLPSSYSGGVSGSAGGKILLAAGDKIGSNFYIGDINPASPSIINWVTEWNTPVKALYNSSGAGGGNYLVVAGGEVDGVLTANACLYEVDRGWFMLPDLPIALSDAAVASDIIGGGTGDSTEIANFYVIGGKDNSGNLNSVYYLTLHSFKPLSTQGEQEATSPYTFSINLASSNIFNDKVLFRLALPGNSKVEMSIYDISGRSVRTITQNFPAGIHVLSWDGKDNRGLEISDGSYFYLINTNYGNVSGKFTRIR